MESSGEGYIFTHTHTHTRIYIYIYIYICVCVVGEIKRNTTTGVRTHLLQSRSQAP